MTDEQQSAARLADRGEAWGWIDYIEEYFWEDGDKLRQALHGRDRYHREATYWRGEATYWRGEAERLQRELDEADENAILEARDMASRMDC